MTFIRPELRFALRRWRDVIIGILVLATGARWVFGPGGALLHWIGCGVIVLGGCLCILGYRRAILLQNGGGLGVVDVTERLITYLAPDGGASLSLDSLTRVEIGSPDPEIDKSRHEIVWILHGMAKGPASLSMPVARNI